MKTADISLFEIQEKTIIKYIGTETEIAIPEGIEIIGKNAFKNVNITSVIFPESVKIIEDHAFSHCEKLREIYFTSAIIIGSYAFSYCDINTLFIPYNSAIDTAAFNGYGSLKTVYLSHNTRITRLPFGGFNNCRTVYYEEMYLKSHTDWDELFSYFDRRADAYRKAYDHDIHHSDLDSSGKVLLLGCGGFGSYVIDSINKTLKIHRDELCFTVLPVAMDVSVNSMDRITAPKICLYSEDNATESEHYFGNSCCKGLSTGAVPEKGLMDCITYVDWYYPLIKNCKVLLLTGGTGGGFGTAAFLFITKLAEHLHKQVTLFVTRPFTGEGELRNTVSRMFNSAWVAPSYPNLMQSIMTEVPVYSVQAGLEKRANTLLSKLWQYILVEFDAKRPNITKLIGINKDGTIITESVKAECDKKAYRKEKYTILNLETDMDNSDYESRFPVTINPDRSNFSPDYNQENATDYYNYLLNRPTFEKATAQCNSLVIVGFLVGWSAVMIAALSVYCNENNIPFAVFGLVNNNFSSLDDRWLNLIKNSMRRQTYLSVTQTGGKEMQKVYSEITDRIYEVIVRNHLLFMIDSSSENSSISSSESNRKDTFVSKISSHIKSLLSDREDKTDDILFREIKNHVCNLKEVTVDHISQYYEITSEQAKAFLSKLEQEGLICKSSNEDSVYFTVVSQETAEETEDDELNVDW
ncbi:MAG: leucine-rich repeat domain-containing protein [Erysipelotrichaceae bacterium]|nr:leucine-rich repeat domain-containing protein [Erysipelotrichaceae bacterium]